MTLATNIQLVITSGNEVNEAYPIAGQDNNTQGFRDNFSKTKDGLEAAGSALQELNTRTPKLDSDNNFADDGTIENAIILDPKGKTATISINTSPKTIDVGTAEYFRCRVTEDCPNLKLSGWPNVTGKEYYRKVRLEFFNPNGGSKIIKFLEDETYGTIKYNDLNIFAPNGAGLTVTGNSIIVDAWVSDNSNSSDTGLTMYLQYVGTFTEA